MRSLSHVREKRVEVVSKIEASGDMTTGRSDALEVDWRFRREQFKHGYPDVVGVSVVWDRRVDKGVLGGNWSPASKLCIMWRRDGKKESAAEETDENEAVDVSDNTVSRS
jgi:hypothetical protein